MMAFSYILLVQCLYLLVPGISSDLVSSLERYGLEDVQKYVECSKSDQLQRNECFYKEISYVSCLNMTIRYDTCKSVDIDEQNDNVPDDSPIKHDWKTLQAFYKRHNGIRQRKMLSDGACVEMVEGKCQLYRCVKNCCLGWKADDNGSCNVRIGNDYCHNGGTYDWNQEQCSCLDGYSGSKCEIPICEYGCFNNGECIVSNTGEHVCSCPPYTRGARCDEAICTESCVNGECVVDGTSTVCLCKNGYYGKTCSHAYNGDPRCPTPYSPVCQDLSCTDECTSDAGCPPREACCSDGCCNSCIKPVAQRCFENGKYYNPRKSFKRDNCTTCLCMMNGDVTCSKATCPILNCYDAYHEAGECCPKCRDNSNTVPTGLFPARRTPRIYCTNEVKTVQVKALHSYADMRDLNIKAYGYYTFRSLTVVYKPARLSHCECDLYRRDAVLVEVSATDINNVVSKCQQKVVVLDRHSPRFHFCPSEVFAKEGEPVYWREPIAKDNVGIARLDSNYNRGSYFTSSARVTYTAADYDRNRAFCSFSVHITKTDYQNYDDYDVQNGSSSVGLIVGTLFTSLIIIVIVLTIIYRRIRVKARNSGNNPRHQNHRQRRPQRGAREWEVHISTISNATYDNFAPTPPPYSPATNPPSYEEVFQYSQQVNDDNKPPEYENVVAEQREGTSA